MMLSPSSKMPVSLFPSMSFCFLRVLAAHSVRMPPYIGFMWYDWLVLERPSAYRCSEYDPYPAEEPPRPVHLFQRGRSVGMETQTRVSVISVADKTRESDVASRVPSTLFLLAKLQMSRPVSTYKGSPASWRALLNPQF